MLETAYTLDQTCMDSNVLANLSKRFWGLAKIRVGETALTIRTHLPH